MKPNIINKKIYTLSELKDLFYFWLEADEFSKINFIDRRISLIKKYAGCEHFFDTSSTLKTSGTTTGIIKKYHWGPCFQEQYDFFEWLKFQNRESAIVYFNHKHKLNQPYLYPYGEKSFALCCDFINQMPDINLLYKLCNDDKKIVLWIPSWLQSIMIQKIFDFQAFDQNKYIIYNTGSKPIASCREYFNKLNFEYIDAMRMWQGGATFITCKYGNAHWIDFLSKIEVNDNLLISSDLFNLAQIFINFESGDKLKSKRLNKCLCGLYVDEIDFFERDATIEFNGTAFSFSKLAYALRCVVNKESNLLYSCSFGFKPKEQELHVYYDVNPQNFVFTNEAKDAFLELSQLKNMQVTFINQTLHGIFKEKKLFFIGEEII